MVSRSIRECWLGSYPVNVSLLRIQSHFIHLADTEAIFFPFIGAFPEIKDREFNELICTYI